MSIQNGESKMWMGAYLPDYPDAESYLNPYYSLSEGNRFEHLECLRTEI